MLLYKKQFSLPDEISVSTFIRKLEDKAFPPYVLKVEKVTKKNKYNLRPIFLYPIPPWGTTMFPGGMLLNNCVIEFSRNEKEFVLSGTSTGWRLFLALSLVVMSLSLLLFGSFAVLTHDMSLEEVLGNFIVILVGAIFVMYPAMESFNRERKLLNKIGSFATKMNKE